MAVINPFGGSEPAKELRWLSATAAIASISVVGIAIGLGMPLLSVLLEYRGYSASMIGLNTAVGGVASIVGAPLAVPVAARLGTVRTMLVAIAAGGLAFLGFYFSHSFLGWTLLRVVLNLSLTVLFILSEFWITSSAPPHRRGFVLGLYATVLSLGFAAGPWLFSMIGSQGLLPFAIAFALIVLAAFPVALAWRESPDISGDSTMDAGFLRYILLVPAATIAVLIYGAVETGGFALFPVYGARIGYTESETALLLTMIGLGNVLLQIPLGMVSDRMRDRRILLVICATIGLGGMLLLPFIAHVWYLTAAMLFVWGGVVAGLYTVGLAHLGSRLTGRDLASANAAFVLCYGIGMLAGPQMIGVSMDAFGAHGFAWALAVFFGLYASIVGVRVVFTRGRA